MEGYSRTPVSSDGMVFLPGLLGLVFGIAVIVGLWKTFKKAGRPGWAAIIPFYNLYIILQISGKPGWWLLLYFIPIVNIIVSLIVSLQLAKVFNKSAAFGVFLLWFFSGIGYLILGFGKSIYTGNTLETQIPKPA